MAETLPETDRRVEADYGRGEWPGHEEVEPTCWHLNGVLVARRAELHMQPHACTQEAPVKQAAVGQNSACSATCRGAQAPTAGMASVFLASNGHIVDTCMRGCRTCFTSKTSAGLPDARFTANTLTAARRRARNASVMLADHDGAACMFTLPLSVLCSGQPVLTIRAPRLRGCALNVLPLVDSSIQAGERAIHKAQPSSLCNGRLVLHAHHLGF